MFNEPCLNSFTSVLYPVTSYTAKKWLILLSIFVISSQNIFLLDKQNDLRWGGGGAKLNAFSISFFRKSSK